MGSPIAPILADFVMDHVIDNVIGQLPMEINVYKYVDDLLLFIPEDESIRIVNIFNSVHDKLVFTIEEENEQSLPFLDLMLHRGENNTIRINWYRKKHKSDRFLNFKSHHPKSQIINCAYGLKNRALKLSDAQFHLENLIKIGNILKRNLFPPKLISKIVKLDKQTGNQTRNIDTQSCTTPTSITINNTHQSSPPTPLLFPTTPKADKYCSMVYVKGLSERLVKCLKKLEIKLAFYNRNTLSEVIFSHPKDPIPKFLRSNLVYSIPCLGCGKVYIGETSQHLSIRLEQHKYTIKKHLLTSGLSQHAIEFDHDFDFDSTSILEYERNRQKRLFKEKVNIKNNSNTCNIQRDVEGLSNFYCNVICAKY